MKKSIQTVAIVLICCLMISFKSGYGQASKKDLTDPKTLLAVVRLNDPSTFEKTNAAPVTDVNAKAIRDFKKTFKTVSNETWYELPNSYVAEFTSGSKKSLVAYDKKGNWKFTILYYSEKELPEDVRSDVKSIYYDYSISRVEEIHIDRDPIYLIHMQNEKTWKNVRVCDGEVQLLEDFNKQ